MGDHENSVAAAEARWRNYQHLIWTQQQIQLQIQHQQNHHQPQQQMQNQKMQNGVDMEGGNNTNGLQPVPMAEKSLEEKPKSEAMDPWDNFDAQAAFLGPTLWDKRLPYDGQDFKLEYVDLEEFLTENGIPVEAQQHHQENFMKNGHGPPNNGGMSTDQVNNDCSPQQNGGAPPPHAVGQYGPGPSRNQGHINPNQQNLMRGPPSINQSGNSRSPSPCGSSISRSSDESDTTSHPDSHPPGVPKLSKGVRFSIAELALASIPGQDFDPRTRIFTEDELKPQPMIKKSKKQFVPDEAKDAKYWARRRKNNMAAKRSRDARRVKENQIAMRACFLEKENAILKQEIDRIQKENMMLKEQLNCCRREH